MREYVTVQGDTWDLIALRVYGSEKYMTKLIEANPEHRETVFFSGYSAESTGKLPRLCLLNFRPGKGAVANAICSPSEAQGGL